MTWRVFDHRTRLVVPEHEPLPSARVGVRHSAVTLGVRVHDDEHTREPDKVEDEIEETLPTTFAEGFGLKKSQFELDFVDVPLNEDLPLFVDPFALSQRKDDWSINAHRTLAVFFQQVIDLIRKGSEEEAGSLLSHLAETSASTATTRACRRSQLGRPCSSFGTAS